MRRSPPTGSRHEMNWPGRNAGRGPRRKSERVSAACSTIRATVASCSAAIASALLVDRVARDHDHDLRVRLLDHRLAAEARGRRQPRSLVEQVVLALLRLGERLPAALDDHVTRRAGTVPPARML